MRGACVDTMKNIWIVLFIVSLSLTSCQKKNNSRGFSTKLGITLDSSVPEDERDLIDNDLSVLYNLSIQASSANDLQVIGVDSLYGPSLSSWLKTRVSFIVGETFDFQDQADIAGYRPYQPQVFSRVQLEDELLAQNSLVTIMVNIGAALYRYGKNNSQVLSLDVGGKRVYIKSPRVGVIQIGQGLFSAWSVRNTPKDSLANSLIRLSVFFHEGRHSDGNGSNVTFPHAECPDGHSYEGNYSCDGAANGPYVIDSIMLKNLRNACTGCNNTEIQTFKMFQADAESRLLPGSYMKDTRPEQIQ